MPRFLPFVSAGRASALAAVLGVLLAPCGAGGATTPLVETVAMHGSGDVADGVCVWIHPTDRSRSLILGANKSEVSSGSGGIYAFNLDGGYASGTSWQPGVNWFDAGQKINISEVAYNFRAGAETWDLLCAANRTQQTIDVFRVETNAGGDLTGLTQVGAITPTALSGDCPYGLAVFHPTSQGGHSVVVSDKRGHCEQLELVYDAGAGRVTGSSVWSADIVGDGIEVEGIAADNDREVVYIASEDTNLYRYATSGGVIQSAGRVLVHSTSGPALAADIEGMAIYYGDGGQGYLIASSQGSSQFAVYQRSFSGSQPNAHVMNFTIQAGNGIDKVSGTDDITVVSTDLGGRFARGLFVAHDGEDDSPTTWKLVDWADVADEVVPNLAIYTGWDPRAVLLPGDADRDGVVGVLDYLAVKRHIGSAQATWSDGDFNYDGQVGRLDFLALKVHFTGAADGSLAAAAVPEPAAIACFAASLLALLRRARRR
jgi:3-phytase